MNQKKFNLKFRFSLLFCLFGGIHGTYAQTLDTTIIRSINIGGKDVIYLKNQLNDITVKTWTKNEFRAEYTLYAEGASEEQLSLFTGKLVNSIDNQLKQMNSGKVTASFPFKSILKNKGNTEVVFEEGRNRYHLRDLKNSLVVYMPETNSLNVESYFNKLTIENLKSDVTVKIGHAQFRMGDCRALQLEAAFSKGMKIGNVESAVMRINSCDLEMGSVAKDLTLVSNFSRIGMSTIGNYATFELNSSSFTGTDIGKLDLKGSFIRDFKAGQIGSARININSSDFEASRIKQVEAGKLSFSNIRIRQSDNLKIGVAGSTTFALEEAGTIESEDCSFTSFAIDNLKNRFTTKANSGNIRIKNVLPGFDNISITGSFVTTEIHIDATVNYVLNADMTFPEYHFGDIKYSRHDKDMNHEIISAWKGSKELAKSSITLNCQSCTITVD